VPLTLDKRGRGSAANGAQGADRLITYTLTISNLTVVLARDVVVSDALPANLTYVAGSASIAPQSERPLVWRVDVPANGSITIRFTTRDTAAIAAPVRNVATVISGGQIVSQHSTDVLTVQRPTAVLLDILSATPGSSGAVVFWRTTQELNAHGYHVLRASSDARHLAEQVTTHLIPARGADGAEYAFVDANAVRGVAYHYWLQEVQLDGSVREYGPVVLAEPPLQSVINTQQGVIVPIPFGGIPATDVAFPAANLAQTKVGGSAIALTSKDLETLVRVTPTGSPQPLSAVAAVAEPVGPVVPGASNGDMPAAAQPDRALPVNPALDSAPAASPGQQVSAFTQEPGQTLARVLPPEIRRIVAAHPSTARSTGITTAFGAGLMLVGAGLLGLALLVVMRSPRTRSNGRR
jgi:uncharacterized repeat protein (TIGR01451 family)